MEKKDLPIGFMDSGLGGLSVLKEALRIMPYDDFIYYGDSRNAPYGEKAPEQILRMCRDNLEMFLSLGAKCVVIACNTATSAAAEDLRKEYPWLPIIGMEHPWRYRNKAQFPFGRDKDGNIIAGFYAGRSHRIVPCEDCLLGVEENRRVLEIIKDFMNR